MEQQIYAKGLCHSCYQQEINEKNPNYKRNQERWRKQNKKYFRDYYRKRLNIPKDKWRKE